MPKVYTPNAGFTGWRNAGRFSVLFKNGVADCTDDEAEVMVENFGYLCPEVMPEHQERVDAIRRRDEPAPIGPPAPAPSGEIDKDTDPIEPKDEPGKEPGPKPVGPPAQAPKDEPAPVGPPAKEPADKPKSNKKGVNASRPAREGRV